MNDVDWKLTTRSRTMPIIMNMNGTDLIPFNQDHYTVILTFVSIDLVLLFLGILSETLVIAAICRVRQKSADALFVLSLCCADLICNLFQFPTLSIALSAGGWKIGALGCKFSVSFIIATLGTSIVSITFITLNRYLAIIWKRNITRTQSLWMILAGWLFFPTCILLYASNQQLTDSSVALQPSNIYCMLDFSSSNPIVLIVLIIIFAFMTFPLIFMIYAYSRIILFYMDMNRKKKKSSSEVFCLVQTNCRNRS